MRFACLRPVHTVHEEFENAAKIQRLGPRSTQIRHENGAFRKRFLIKPEEVEKASFSIRFRVDRKHFENGAFRKRQYHDNGLISLTRSFFPNTNQK